LGQSCRFTEFKKKSKNNNNKIKNSVNYIKNSANCEDLELSLTFMSKAGGETLKGILLVLLANVGLGWKGWPGRSALAYLDSLSEKKKKRSYNFNTWGQC
jgi:hypothetical protein